MATLTRSSGQGRFLLLQYADNNIGEWTLSTCLLPDDYPNIWVSRISGLVVSATAAQLLPTEQAWGTLYVTRGGDRITANQPWLWRPSGKADADSEIDAQAFSESPPFDFPLRAGDTILASAPGDTDATPTADYNIYIAGWKA